MKIINKVSELVYQHRYVAIVLFVLLNMVAKGLNLWQYTIYNFDPLYLKENGERFFLDPIIMMNNNGAWVLNKFNEIFKYFLQVPILYIVSSILIKSTIIYLLYLIIEKLTREKNLSFVIALFFAFSIGYEAHGAVLNGMFEAPIFFRASVSALMTLIGLYLVLSNRHYLAIIPFALSIHLHALYGVTSFAFIFTSFIFYYIMDSKISLKNFIMMSLVVFLSILPIVLAMDSISFETINSNIDNWYSYIFATDPDDMSMFWYLGMGGYFAVPFLLLSLYFVYINKKKQIIDYLFLGSFIFFLFIVSVEILHYNSVFFGGLSEKFIGVQLRRGIWVLMLFGTIINFVNIFNKIEHNNKIAFYLIAFGFIYLFPNLFALIVMLVVASLHLKQAKLLYLLIASIFVTYIGHTLGFFQISDSQYKVLALLAVLTVTISILYYYKLLNKNNLLVFMIISFLTSISIVGLATKKHFQNDIKAMTNNGFFSTPNLLELEKSVYEKQEKVINHKIIEYIRENNSNNKFVLEAIDNLFYGDAIIYDAPVFISRVDIGMPMFSRVFYEHLLFKLNTFSIDELNLHSSKGNTLDAIEMQINSLTKKEIHILNKQYNVKFLITKSRYDFLEPSVSENGYFLYDLEMLK